MNIALLAVRDLRVTGGCEVFTLTLARCLDAKGHSVFLYTLAQTKSGVTALLPSSVTIKTLPSLFPQVYRRSPFLAGAWLLKEHWMHGFDVWQGMGAYPEGVCLSLVAQRVPCFIRFFGEDVQMDEALAYGVRRDARIDHRIRSTLPFSRVIAMTDSLAREARAIGIAQNRIHHIPNGVDCERLAAPVDKDALRKALGIPAKSTLLLTVGRNHPKKYFDAIPQIASRLPQGKWLWIVVGKDSERLSPAVKGLQLQEKVILWPSMDAVTGQDGRGNKNIPPDSLVQLYQAADIFVLPSKLEGFSRVIGEALAAGLPVVTTDAPGCGEIFENGKQGFVIATEQIVPGFAEKLSLLLENNDLRHRQAEEAKRLGSQFDWLVVVSRYEAAYLSSGINGGRTPRPIPPTA